MLRLIRAAAAVTLWLGFGLGLGIARAEDVPSSPELITTVTVQGNSRTRRDTLLELLPRQPPATFSDRELMEVERRIDNLALFDRVRVVRYGTRLQIEVREKWTLIPEFDFASSKTLADTYALVGLTEYNAFGTGNQLGLSMYREQRGWGAVASYVEHPYRRHRWALAVDASASTARFRFEDGSGWENALFNFQTAFISPPWLSDHLNYKVGAYYAREIIRAPVGDDLPPSSHALGTSLVFTWDAYRWADFVPSGVRAELWLSSGAFLGTAVPQPRHLARLHLVVAQPLARYTVLTARAVFAVSTRGNAGFSQLLGSMEGVRGLEDGLYRNWAQAYGNLELRQAVPIADRWAVQGVLFSDVAAFEQIAPNGGRGAVEQAVSTGAGLRVVPTWLANVVIRADVARLLTPYQTWFLQVALNQYF